MNGIIKKRKNFYVVVFHKVWDAFYTIFYKQVLVFNLASNR